MTGGAWDCYLSIGANLGARARTLREALRRLAGLPGTRLVRTSSFYETAPWGKTDQPPFLNGAVHLQTRLSPEALLAACQDIECALGRVRHEHWGARTIDIDLVYGTARGAVVRRQTERLTLPHPYLLARAFVLVPLAEIAPALVLAGRPLAAWCEETAAQAVRRSAAPAAPFPLRLIACIDRGRGLGRGGTLLYDLPEDLARFRALTKTPGSVLIMGRRTAESLPHGPLPGRCNLVLSRTRAAGEGARAAEMAKLPEADASEASGQAPAWAAALPRAQAGEAFVFLPDGAALFEALAALFRAQPRRPVWVIGGASVYRALLPYVGAAYLTEVADQRVADAFLPELLGFARVRAEAARTPGVTFSLFCRPGVSVPTAF